MWGLPLQDPNQGAGRERSNSTFSTNAASEGGVTCSAGAGAARKLPVTYAAWPPPTSMKQYPSPLNVASAVGPPSSAAMEAAATRACASANTPALGSAILLASGISTTSPTAKTCSIGVRIVRGSTSSHSPRRGSPLSMTTAGGRWGGTPTNTSASRVDPSSNTADEPSNRTVLRFGVKPIDLSARSPSTCAQPAAPARQSGG